MKTRKFAITLEMQLEAGSPEEAAERFEVEVLEDRGEDEWLRVGRRLVQLGHDEAPHALSDVD